MEKKEITFSVQMTTKDMYRFTMYHGYCKFSGVLSVFISIASLVVLIMRFDTLSDQNKAILTFLAVLFTILEPLSLYSRSRKQVKRTPAYQKPLTYCLNEEGITVSQDEERQTIAWQNLMKIVETKSQYLVYSSKIHAFVFPKSALGEQCGEVSQLMRFYTNDCNVRLVGMIKKENR